MEKEFLLWYEREKEKFRQAQFNDIEIAYAAWSFAKSTNKKYKI